MTAISWNSAWAGANGHELRMAAAACGLRIAILLDGQQQTKVVWVDPDKGELARVVCDEDGNKVIEGKGTAAKVVTETLKGAITFRIDRIADA